MSDKEVKIGNKVIGENTKVTVTVKTLAWVIGGVITLFSTLFTLAYFDLKSELDETKSQMEAQKTAYEKEVKQELNVIVDQLRENDEDFLREIGEMKGDIKVILDRTNSMRDKVENPTTNNNQPLEIALPQ